MPRFLFALLTTGVFVSLPLVALAAPATFFGPIISETCNCAGRAPNWGCALEALQNSLNFAVSIGVIIVTLVIAYAGILWITSPMNPHNRELGRTMLLNAVIGLVITLSGWLMVDFVMKAIYNEGAVGPWNSILGDDPGPQCFEATPIAGAPGDGDLEVGTSPTEEEPGEEDTPPEEEEPQPTTGRTLTNSCTGETRSGANRGVVKSTLTCTNCVALTGLTCSHGCNLRSAIASEVQALDRAFTGTLRITEAYPPSSCAHGNSCHYDGTCVDAAFEQGATYTAENVRAFMTLAQQAGLNPYFETRDCDLRTALRAAGIAHAFCNDDPGYGAVTGNHFSLYGN